MSLRTLTAYKEKNSALMMFNVSSAAANSSVLKISIIIYIHIRKHNHWQLQGHFVIGYMSDMVYNSTQMPFCGI